MVSVFPFVLCAPFPVTTPGNISVYEYYLSALALWILVFLCRFCFLCFIYLFNTNVQFVLILHLLFLMFSLFLCVPLDGEKKTSVEGGAGV